MDTSNYFTKLSTKIQQICTQMSMKQPAEHVREYLRRFHETINRAARILKRAEESN